MLSKEDIITIVASELANSNSTVYSNQGSISLEDSLSYYLGLPNGTEIEGRSQIVSTDVADAIEWIMPQIMKSFTQNNEVVIFDPVHDGDEKQAELESEYVYEVLMKQNDGFIILYQFVKDALMQRNGILKCYYAKHTDTKTSEYTGITEDQLNQLLSGQGIELIEHSSYVDQDLTLRKQQAIQMQLSNISDQMEDPDFQRQLIADPGMAAKIQDNIAGLQQQLEISVELHDVKVSVERIRGQIYVDPVPPEEFRLNSQHNSICLEKARFTAHVTMKTASDIIEEFDLTLDETKDLPEGATFYDREYRFTLQGDSAFNDRGESADESQRLIEVAECFMQMDIEETGISKLMKITVAGGDDPTDLLKIEELDSMPWISTTAFLMSHKFEGLSITDRLKQIQDQKTALWRNMFDNIYFQNNQQKLVIESQVNMDDLLVSRPGGIVRAKRADAVTPLVTPQLGQDAYQMMEYLDQVRAGRTGVDPDGQANPTNIGDRVGSQGVDRLLNAKEELVGLIVRVIAETGVKPLCVKIRDLSIQHIDAVVDFRFRGQWYQINPRTWCDRTKCTVRVGTGTGNHQIQVAALGSILEIQKQLAEAGHILVSDSVAFNALDDYCKFSGLNGAVRYFVDPSSPQGQEARAKKDQQISEEKAKNDEIERIMVESQNKIAEAEQAKVVVQQQNAQLKSQVDHIKNMSEAEIQSLKQQLEEVKAALAQANADADREQRERSDIRRVALELTRIEKDSEKDENENFQGNKEDAA